MNQGKSEAVLNWIPRQWTDFVGNKTLKKYLLNLVARLRNCPSATPIPMGRLPLLIGGASRTGKTSMVNCFVRSLVCNQFNSETHSLCQGVCRPCQVRPENGSPYIDAGNARQQGALNPRIEYVDCSLMQTREGMLELVRRLEWADSGKPTIAYLDEAHRLSSRGFDELLLRSVDDSTAILWLLVSAHPNDLATMLRKRFIQFRTELPTKEELEAWLKAWCEQHGIRFEENAIERAGERANFIPGIALQALELASLDPQNGLTTELVNELWQPANE